MKVLLAAGAEVNLQEEDGRTALFRAVVSGHREVVVTLLAGADPNLEARHRTIIEEAVFRGYASLIPILVQAGAHLQGRAAKEEQAAVSATRAEMRQDFRAIIRSCRDGADTPE